jgi:O-antigen ligase
MPIETAVIGSIIFTAMVGYFIAWLHSVSSRIWRVSRQNTRTISWVLLISWLVSRTIIFVRRDSPDQLLTEGLSAQNIYQLAVVALILVWDFVLMYRRHVTFGQLLVGPRIWTTGLAIVFLVSAGWSVWPQFTVFRALEVLGVWILVLHIFASFESNVLLEKFMLWSIGLGLVGSVWINGGLPAFDRIIFAALRSNTGGTVAATYILYLINYKVRCGIIPIWKWFFAILSFILFGSTAAAIAFLIAMPIVLFSRLRFVLRTAITLLLLAFLLPVAGNLPGEIDNTESLETFAGLFGKSSAHVITLTGRIPLWEAIWEVSRHSSFGWGYAAGERIFALGGFTTSRGGWQAFGAHSGYISAWIGAGWLGVFGVLAVFISLTHYGRFVSRRISPFFYAYLLFLALNNITIAGIGGYMNQAWIILMALACHPTKVHENSNLT